MNDNKHPEQDPAEGRGKPSRGIQSGRSRWVRIKIKSREARMSRALKPPNRRQNNPLKRGPAKGSAAERRVRCGVQPCRLFDNLRCR